MKLAGVGLLALPALLMPMAAVAQDAEIVVRGDVARIEIERILEADNVDTSRLSSRQVADAMAGIERGRAPDDFWAAYRAHVAAWVRLADVETASRRRSVSRPEDAAALVMAQQAIETSFDEVERLARNYRARLPTPPWRIRPTI